MKRLKNPLAIYLQALLFLVLITGYGCSSPVMLGYLNTSNDYISPYKERVGPQGDYLFIDRDTFSNSFNISISSKYYTCALNSLDKNYQMLLIFSSTEPLPPGPPDEVYSPSFYSSNIIIGKASSDVRNKTELLPLQVNELGKDFLLASLTTAAGIQGYFRFKDHTVLFKANLIRSGTQTSKVYLVKNLFGNYLEIESIVEYPILFTCHFQLAGNKTKVSQLTVGPWARERVRIPCGSNLREIGSIKIVKQLIYNSPIEFKQ